MTELVARTSRTPAAEPSATLDRRRRSSLESSFGADAIRHPSLLVGAELDTSTKTTALEEADLSDRDRVGVLLQGAAILAHLEHAGWSLRSGFSRAGLDSDRRLRAPDVQRGWARAPAQRHLTELTQRLFRAEGEVAGRGQARRLVRGLQRRWAQEITRQPADRLVGEILERAPFLWRRSFAIDRISLLSLQRRGGEWTPWIAGPGFLRRRLFALAKDRSESMAVAIEQELRGRGAAEAWKGTGRDPIQLAASSRWSAAVRAWSVDPPTTEQSRRIWASCLFRIGRFEDALAALRGLRGLETDILRIRCQHQLGQLPAVRRALRALNLDRLAPSLIVTVGDVALRTLANTGDQEAARDWLRRLMKVKGEHHIQALLVAAQGYWDLRDLAAMERCLHSAAAAVDQPKRAWIYHQSRALLAIARGDGDAAVKEVTLALGKSRRELNVFEAGRLWNDLVLARVTADDLAGAERACRHSLRLLEVCDGQARNTLALYNLAELRIRRGQLDGARRILERSTRENRLAKNVRGAAQDAELWARFELARGRPADALNRCWEGLDALAADGLEWNREELQVLQARALAWLGQRDQSRELLECLDSRVLSILEPEEGPMLLAQVGLVDRAKEAAVGTRIESLLTRVIEGVAPSWSAWDELERIEPFRVARLIYDIELLRPGLAPYSFRRSAACSLRMFGAEPFAEHLDAGRRGPWKALADYLADQPSPDAIRCFFEAAGHPDASLSFEPEIGGDNFLLVEGNGGRHEIDLRVEGGSWKLRSAQDDEVLEVFLRLVARELPTPKRPSSIVRQRPAGVVGESKQIVTAWHRLQRLGTRSFPVLVLGETGTGKEIAAQFVHDASERHRGPFLPINCAAMSETLVLSDLFGHAKGAFTGADVDRAGVFESARGGTVFLDEVGDLPAVAQGMLLRVLQEGEIRRLGESRVRKVDVRIVAATLRDLDRWVESGQFRQDLFYRLSVGRVTLPPLRDRGDDILLLADHFLTLIEPRLRLSEAARRELLRYRWPGNVRDLRNTLERAVVRIDEGVSVITPEDLDLPSTLAAPQPPYHEWLNELKKQRLREELETCGGNQAEAARRLGLSRQALSYLVRQLDLI